ELASVYWEPLIKRGARMARSNDSKSARVIVDMVLTTQKTVLDLQKELVDEKRALLKTTAGEDIAEKIRANITAYETELGDIHRLMSEVEANNGHGREPGDLGMIRRLILDEEDIKARIAALKQQLSESSSRSLATATEDESGQSAG